MEANPLKDIAEKIKQQNIEQQLQNIQADLKILKGRNSMKLIELEVVDEVGPYNMKKLISLNPQCISYIEGVDDDLCYIHIGNDSIRVSKSREEVLAMISDNSGKSYIK